jgi:hypothetical protein
VQDLAGPEELAERQPWPRRRVLEHTGVVKPDGGFHGGHLVETALLEPPLKKGGDPSRVWHLPMVTIGIVALRRALWADGGVARCRR